MRNIEVRARDVFTGKILTQLYMGQCFQWVNHERQHNIIIEQFTGLTDINGLDVYEGDLLHCLDPVAFEPLTVECSETHAGFSVKVGKYTEVVLCANYIKTNELVVIGNIHQNKELLK